MISKKHNELIIRYLNNTISKSEKKYFFELIEKDPSFKKEYFLQKDRHDYSFMKNNNTFFNIEKEWNILNQAIKTNKFKLQNSGHKVIGLPSFWIKAAAIFLLSFGLGWLGKYFFNNITHHNNNLYSITVPRGQQSKLTLTDGTVVWINSHSEIKIPSDFSANNRNIYLEGEAYFDVAKDARSPFSISTNKIKIKVLGTSFNIRTYNEEKDIITTLEKGKIQLISETDKRIITPGEQLVYNKETKSIKKNRVITKYFTSWKDGKFYMNNMSFDQLIYMLEIWYDYKFIYDKSDFLESHFTGVIKREKDIEYILNIIDQVTPISYKIEEEQNKIILTKLK